MARGQHIYTCSGLGRPWHPYITDVPSRLQYLVPELQAVMGLRAVSPSHSQYLVPELRMARGGHIYTCSGLGRPWHPYITDVPSRLQYLVPELQAVMGLWEVSP